MVEYKGKVIQWNDEKGFGFIQTKRSNERYFFHISDVQNKSRRPSVGTRVKFQAGKKSKNQIQAVNIRCRQILPRGPAFNAFLVSALFLSGLGVLTHLNRLALIILVLYGAVSLLTLIFYALDKSSAQKSQQRVPEATLHYLALAGGWPGALFAQQWLRHKSQKRTFRRIFWLTVAMNGAALGFLVSPYGQWLNTMLNQIKLPI